MDVTFKKLCPHCNSNITNYKVSMPRKTMRGGRKGMTNNRPEKCPSCGMIFREHEIVSIIVPPEEQYKNFLRDIASRDIKSYAQIGWPTMITKAAEFMKHYDKTVGDFDNDLRQVTLQFEEEMYAYFIQ